MRPFDDTAFVVNEKVNISYSFKAVGWLSLLLPTILSWSPIVVQLKVLVEFLYSRSLFFYECPVAILVFVIGLSQISSFFSDVTFTVFYCCIDSPNH